FSFLYSYPHTRPLHSFPTRRSSDLFLTQYKLSGSYPLPWGVSLGAFFQSVPGTERTITYLVTRAVVPQLTLASATIPLTEPGSLDRKSTRLNSSHGSISYAVFCLKK